MSDYGVILFHTSSAAMRAEAVLHRAKVAVKLIPTPREFSSDCGISLRFDWSQKERVGVLLSESRVEVAEIHRLTRR